MHAVITGAGGFVGQSVVQACLDRDWAVTAVYRRTRPSHLPRHRRLALVSTDLRQCEGLPRQYDYLVHCAADVPATCPDPDELLRNNVEGTRRVLEHAAQAGAHGVIYMSSMAVYGAISVSVVDETTVPASPGGYGISKAEGEKLVLEWTQKSRRRALSIRLPGVVGAGGRNNFLCETLSRILAGGIIVARNPDALFNNVVHVRDLARFVAWLLPNIPESALPLTLGALDPLPIRDVLERMASRAGRTIRVQWDTPAGRSFLIRFERAVALGYRPATVADTLDRFVADVLGSPAAN